MGDQCRARDCGKGKVTVINKKRGESRMRPMQFGAPLNWNNSVIVWVRGTLSLFTVPACYFPSNPPKNFLFLFLEYPSTIPLVPRVPPTPAEPCTASINVPFNALKLSHTPLSPRRMIPAPSRSRHLPQPPLQYSLLPFPRPH